jgi:hypothetical protein
MTNATRIVVSTSSTWIGLAGLEHGIGEILQGNVAPAGLMILSWPKSEQFRVLGGEPAMTLLPNLIVAGILTILFSLAFIVWATVFIQRKNGGLVLMLLSVAMLLVGGGIATAILGFIIGAAGTRIDSPLTWWRTHLPTGSRRLCETVWPWFLALATIAWLLVFPGLILLASFFGADSLTSVVPVIIFSAFGFLLLAVSAGFGHDVQRQTSSRQLPSAAG